MRSTHRSDDGAAAVEFALVVPILIAIVLATIEFGYRYQRHIQYTNAAMQSARSMSITNDTTTTTTEARSIVGNPAAVVTVSSGGCSSPNTTVSVTVKGTPTSLTHMFGSTFTVTAKGQVRCE